MDRKLVLVVSAGQCEISPEMLPVHTDLPWKNSVNALQTPHFGAYNFVPARERPESWRAYRAEPARQKPLPLRLGQPSW